MAEWKDRRSLGPCWYPWAADWILKQCLDRASYGIINPLWCGPSLVGLFLAEEGIIGDWNREPGAVGSGQDSVAKKLCDSGPVTNVSEAQSRFIYFIIYFYIILFFFFFFFFFFLFLLFHTHLAAHEILVPWPGIKLMLPTMETFSLNHWTARRVP